ncbi:MAG: hypothetical protein K0R38_99 [Polyangiaceae bacterium]|jgi:uncharacterized membrane protein|nr:hypothetical protein [Polyangiaceae bacterium]
MKTPLRTTGPVVLAGQLLGCGLGAFFDGILLHQILQWHSMLSSVRPPLDLVTMKYNMLWDGVFHAFAWVVTVLGVVALWTAARRPQVRLSSPAFGGALLLGWGLFNVVEGLVDHQLLGLHHVHPGELEQAWDIGFILWGVAMAVVGILLIRRVAAPPPVTVRMGL